MTSESLFEAEGGLGRLKGIILVIGLIIFAALLFSSTKNVAVVYFVFGVVSIFTAVVYLQIQASDPGARKATLKDEDYPSLAVLIPNCNGSKTLERCLESIVRLKYPRQFEIIAIDDHSSDNSLEIMQRFAKEHSSIRIVRNGKNIGKAASLNNASRMTGAEIVACIDSDTYPCEDALVNMVPCFYKKENIGAVISFINVSNPKNLIQKVQELEYFNAFGFTSKIMSKVNGLIVTPGPMTLFKRKVLFGIGGFDEKNITEDMEMGLRLQKKHYAIEYCPDAIVPTEVPDTFGKLWRQRERWYRGTIFNLEKYKEMMLNKDYGHVGFFSYPTCFIYVGFTILTFAILVWYLSKDLLLRAQILSSSLSVASGNLLNYINYTSGVGIGSLPLLFNSVFLVFFVVLVSFWMYCLYNSMRMAKVKYRAAHIPATAFILLIYPVMISLFYLVSFVKELCGSGMKW